jgi:hypothetical protein
MYVSEKVKYKLRKDICHATSNFESCFIEIENVNKKNVAIGVVYRAHTPIDNFVADIDPLFKKLNAENKHIYVMGDFNIDLLKVDSHRPTHEYLELIYSYHLVPTIYKPTRITESTATIIDNILTNNENIVSSTIVVTDTSDHMPTVLSTNLNITKQSSNTNNLCSKESTVMPMSTNLEKSYQKLNGKKILITITQMMILINSLIFSKSSMMNVFHSKSVLLIEEKSQCHLGSRKAF